MSLLLYAVLAVVVLGGGGLGAWAYLNMQRQQPDGDGDADLPEDADADAAESAGLDIDRPEPEFSHLGAVAAGAISLIPNPERGVRESARALVDRPEPQYSRLGGLAAKLISIIPKPLFGVRETLFKRLAVKSIENYHKVAGGDAMAINALDGQQIALEPVKYKPPEACDEGERPGWHVKGREKVWHPAKEGNSVNYLGRTPIATFQDDAHVEAGWLAPRVGQAIEMDQYWPLFTDPEITAHIDYGGAAQNGALADGGTGTINFELEDMGQYADDAIVDLGSGPGYDGMRISMSKAREWQTETAASEKMQMQEDRGYLRGLANGDGGPSVTKLLLICAAIILGTLLIVFAVPEFLSSGGGGGGGINPLMLFGGL